MPVVHNSHQFQGSVFFETIQFLLDNFNVQPQCDREHHVMFFVTKFKKEMNHVNIDRITHIITNS